VCVSRKKNYRTYILTFLNLYSTLGSKCAEHVDILDFLSIFFSEP
jgi:hypothetical protein